MFFARVVLVMEIVQWGLIGAGYLLPSPVIRSTMLIYGSPLYMIFHLLTGQSALSDNNPYIIALLVWHVLKYFSFFKTQVDEDRSVKLVIAAAAEVGYLALSGYLFF
jgi:hypothetical protein